MRKVALTLVAVAVALGLTTAAQQPPPAQPTLEIKIVPERPTVNDRITVELSGTFPDRCAPQKVDKAVVELNQVTIWVINEQEFCVEGQTPWKLSVPVPQVNTDGKRLEAGPYQVVVLFSMEKDPDEYLLLGRKRFEITGGGAGSNQVLFTVMMARPLGQSRSGFVLEQANPRDPRWVSRAFEAQLSSSGGRKTLSEAMGTLGVPSGGGPLAITTVKGTKSNCDNRIVGYQGTDIKIISASRGGSNNDELEVQLEITGSNPTLTFLVEQVD
ncbi:MAG: hypothetical protein RMJ29_05965, partial [Candidatus Bipolaricaulota bacterium]|nr:hypothetical protein [Candidatus Bipolaricaulota bacterium]